MQIQSTRKTVVVATLFAALSGVSGLGNANLSDVSVESLKVSYADLNLNRKDAQETLYERLQQAADKVCGNESSRAIEIQLERRKCYENALNDAVQRVGNAELSSLHRS